MFDFFAIHGHEISKATIEHVQLTLVAVIFAIIIGIPLGIIAAKKIWARQIIFSFINAIQAIPSLALLGVLIPFLGIGVVPAIVMVFIYAILPIVKNTAVGFEQIPTSIIEAAESLGLTWFQKLIKIELPLAFPIIITGIRLTTVTAIGLVTIAAFVGAGGLGFLVYSGIQTIDNSLILAGAIPAALLALLFDGFLSWYEKNIKIQKSFKAKVMRRMLLSFFALLILGQVITSNKFFQEQQASITIASKQFTESRILSEIMKRLVEENTRLKVNYKDSLGATSVAFEGIKNASVDAYTEYTGTLYQEILKQIIHPEDTRESVFKKTQDKMQEQYNIHVNTGIGFNNTYAVGIRADIAKQYNLKTISDLSKIANQLDIMTTLEFYNRQDGLKGLLKSYQLDFRKISQGNDSLRYQALSSNQVQVVDAYSTDAAIVEFNIVLLEDNLRYFPPYEAVPIIRQDILIKYPQLQLVLDKMTNLLTDEEMSKLNYQVVHDNKHPREVAENFLKLRKLIK